MVRGPGLEAAGEGDGDLQIIQTILPLNVNKPGKLDV